jgi:GGDEF domain-containing protein
MGIAMYPAGALSAEGLIHDAVNAMLHARERGGNAFHFH